jgi:hypothetical protein
MRWRKVIITILLSFTVALNASGLGFAIANESRNEIVVRTLQLVFSVYLIVVSARSVTQADAQSHAASIIHLSSLTSLASVLLVTVAILPVTPAPVIKARGKSPLQAFWYSLVLLYPLICVLGITTPLGPPLHHAPRNLYSAKTIAATTNQDPSNVSGIIGAHDALELCHPSKGFIGASIWDVLLFSYTTKVVWFGNVVEKLNIGDLPIVPTDMRAAFNYARMRSGLRRHQLRIFSWKPQPGSGWSLAYKLACLNGRALTAELILAAISAVLFYGPAFFLRRLISYLEADPHRENTGWGWVYVFGLFMSNSVMFLGG